VDSCPIICLVPQLPELLTLTGSLGQPPTTQLIHLALPVKEHEYEQGIGALPHPYNTYEHFLSACNHKAQHEICEMRKNN